MPLLWSVLLAAASASAKKSLRSHIHSNYHLRGYRLAQQQEIGGDSIAGSGKQSRVCAQHLAVCELRARVRMLVLKHCCSQPEHLRLRSLQYQRTDM